MERDIIIKVMYTLFLPHFNHTSIIPADFHRITNHKTLFIASRDVPCGRTDIQWS